MGQPTFWDNPEKAQQTIQQLKPLNAVLKPMEELETAAGDLQALAELAEEDASLEPELDGELARMEHRLGAFELRSMLSGPQDASNAYVKIQAGTGGTEACDWAQMLLRMYARWAERQGYQTEIIDELRNDEAGIRSATLRVVGEYAYGNLQHKNDQMALSLLKAKLYRIEEQKRRAEVEKLYDEKGEVAWGYQIRNYVMQPYTLVKDVRTGVETAQVQNVLDGDLDEFIQAYLRLKIEREHKKATA
jgi:protein subunit release factor A